MSWAEHWRWMEWPERLFVLMLAALLAFGAYSIYYLIAHPCIRTERRWVRHEAWTQFIHSGKSVIPIYHAASEGWENVCVERKP